MKYLDYTLLLNAIVSATSLLVPYQQAPQPALITNATVTNVVDGDTIDVEIKRTVRIRLLDCWAPEKRIDNRLPESKQKAEKLAGIASKNNLSTICQGKEVIVSIPVDPSGDISKSITMGRVLGTVWLTDKPDKSLNQIQVEQGYATKTKREELK